MWVGVGGGGFEAILPRVSAECCAVEIEIWHLFDMKEENCRSCEMMFLFLPSLASMENFSVPSRWICFWKVGQYVACTMRRQSPLIKGLEHRLAFHRSLIVAGSEIHGSIKGSSDGVF
jgi:hypothetical protein